MSIKKELIRSIEQIYKRNNEGSFATKADRLIMLKSFAKNLVDLGFGLRNIKGLQQKHIVSIVNYWQGRTASHRSLKKTKPLSIGTIKNRLSAVRHLSKLLNKPSVVPSNKTLKTGNRTFRPVFNRAIVNPDFASIKSSHIRVSLELQRLFGLRREESLKIKPWIADKSDRLELLSSWCKGGRSRTIPIVTNEQRQWLDNAKQLAGDTNHSLIPLHKSYIRHRDVYDKQTNRAGLKNLHGLRHAYAQRRYYELTGWLAPIAGGPQSSQLTRAQKAVDLKSRLILSEELGHSREQITVNYLGR